MTHSPHDQALRARSFALIDAMLASSGATHPIHERGTRVPGGRKLPARFDWVKHPDDTGHRSIPQVAADLARVEQRDQDYRHAVALVSWLTGSPVVEPLVPFDRTAWHAAAIARRDAVEGHRWALGAGAFAGTFQDSTPQVSHWIVFDDEEAQHRLALATDLLAGMLAQVPADATARTLYGLARHAWQRTYRAYDQGARALDVTASQPVRRVRTVTHRQTWDDVADSLVAVSAGAAWESSRDPMRPARQVLALEHAATLFLAHHGEKSPRPDVLNRWTRRHQARPDHVAHAAAARYVTPTPCKYPGGEPAVTADGVQHYPTVLNPTPDQRMTGERYGWIGHERVRFFVALTVRDHRKVTRGKRAQSIDPVGKRGPARSVWSITDRACRKRITTDELRAQVETFEQILRTSALGARVSFGPVTVEIIDGSTVGFRDTVYPVRDWARRATLAGVPID